MISAVCQGLLPTIRHLENRRGEGPGDEVENSEMASSPTQLLSPPQRVFFSSGEDPLSNM